MKSLRPHRDFLNSHLPFFLVYQFGFGNSGRNHPREGSENIKSTMWLFFILVSLGLVFMLYALVQLLRDAKRRPSSFQQSSHQKTGNVQTERVVTMDSAKSERKDSFSKRHRAEWIHGNGEIQIRSISTDGHVVVRRIRASAGRTSAIASKPGCISNAS